MKYTEARSDIRHLHSVYNNAADRGRIADVIAVFMPDGALEVPDATYVGHEAIAAFLTGVGTPSADSVDLRGSRHHLSTSRIEFENDDAAQGWTYFYVMRAGQVIQEGTYIDRYTLAAGGWRIAHRRVKILWTLGRA
ncbi:MAG: nuclear transport factor 2 family protein [Sphingomonadales bacterium]|nr:MAG: nuclear transport factor 2 family protein [Sphingomonadales bacterium]